jgi:hypothetical protein
MIMVPVTVCHHVSAFSTAVYQYLSQVFTYRLRMSEIGLTDHFIYSLVNFCTVHTIKNIRIYLTGTKVESIYGNDIDLFVQDADGLYVWLTFQAKVMSFNGAYQDITLKPAPNQWDKLLQHETDFDSKSYYLLYNGKSNKKRILTPTRKDCRGIPAMEEYGLGIVETADLQSQRLKKTGYIYFSDLFPNHMDSIRKIFCCSLPPMGRKYARQDIETGAPYHLAVTPGVDAGEIATDDNVITAAVPLPNGAAPVRILFEYTENT